TLAARVLPLQAASHVDMDLDVDTPAAAGRCSERNAPPLFEAISQPFLRRDVTDDESSPLGHRPRRRAGHVGGGLHVLEGVGQALAEDVDGDLGVAVDLAPPVEPAELEHALAPRYDKARLKKRGAVVGLALQAV